VIHGMDWLGKHKGPTECARKVIKLTTDSREELEYVTNTLVTSNKAANYVVLNQLDANST
jgi:hypothetical protein